MPRSERLNRLFDVLGPIMIGPSSSHTAGAARLGNLARRLLGDEPVSADMALHGSFAATYKGHGTDLALIGGLLGFAPDDERLPDSPSHAAKAGLSFKIYEADLGDVHPNTVRFRLCGRKGKKVEVTGSSVGGGKVVITEVSGLQVHFTGESDTLVATYTDRPGVIASITAVLAKGAVNIASMRVTRSGRGKTAVCIIEADKKFNSDIVREVESIPLIDKLTVIEKL